MPQTTGTRYGARDRVIAAVASLGVAAIMASGFVPAASAAETLTVGAPKLDLKFEGDVADSSSFEHSTELRGHQGAAPNVTYTDGQTGGTKAIKFGGNTFLDLGSSTELLPSSL